MDYFAELPVDIYQHIFDYLSQLELINILTLNKLIYSQCIKYISNNISFSLMSYASFIYAYEKDQIITLGYFKDKRTILMGFQYACEYANIFMMKMLFQKINRLISKIDLDDLNRLLDTCCLTRELVNRDNRYKNIEDLPIRKYEKVIKCLIKYGATQCNWCNWRLNSGKLHN